MEGSIAEKARSALFKGRPGLREEPRAPRYVQTYHWQHCCAFSICHLLNLSFTRPLIHFTCHSSHLSVIPAGHLLLKVHVFYVCLCGVNSPVVHTSNQPVSQALANQSTCHSFHLSSLSLLPRDVNRFTCAS